MINQTIKVFLIISILFCSCGTSKTSEGSSSTQIEKVSLAFAWDPGPENAFVFLGIDSGFFQEQNLELEIQTHKGSGLVAQMFANDKIDFGFISSDYLVKSRIDGTPMKAIMTLYHQSPVCIFSLKESNITQLEDLYGKRLGVIKQSATYPQVKGMFEYMNLDYAKVEEKQTTSAIQEILHKNIDAAINYVNYAPSVLKAQGYDVNIIYADSCGMEMAGISIATLSKTIRNNPDVVQRFVNAMAKSLKAAQMNSDAALNSLIKRYPTLDIDVAREGLLETERLFYTSDSKRNHPGYLDIQDWQKTQNTLYKIGQIDKRIEDENYFFDDTFFEQYKQKIGDN